MKCIYSFLFLLILTYVEAQVMPSLSENVKFISTFGTNAGPSWGDDDHNQVVFFMVPKDRMEPFYVRVFDPDIGGKYDEVNGAVDTKTEFLFLGGKNCYSNKKSQGVDPVKGYDSGTLLAEKVFSTSKYDDKWFTFGPINPKEGEYIESYDAYVFKLIVKGKSGNDGNLYKVSLSEFHDSNVALSGGNIFTYEYTIRLLSKKGAVTHIAPYIPDNVDELHINTFDFDHDGEICLYTRTKYRHIVATSGNNKWKKSIHKMENKEYNTSLDIQVIKGSTSDNDLTLYITNKYNVYLPMFSIPIGGLPVYNLDVEFQSSFND